MHYVYILESLKDEKMYVGYTNDLRRRIDEHNQGKSFATAPRKPFKLIYYEAYIYREDAEKRERFFKTGWGRNYISRALNNYFKQKFRRDENNK